MMFYVKIKIFKNGQLDFLTARIALCLSCEKYKSYDTSFIKINPATWMLQGYKNIDTPHKT